MQPVGRATRETFKIQFIPKAWKMTGHQDGDAVELK